MIIKTIGPEHIWLLGCWWMIVILWIAHVLATLVSEWLHPRDKMFRSTFEPLNPDKP